MDLIDLIEKRRFVGREFLVFLWFESELFEGMFNVPGFDLCEIGLESTITLTQEKEQSRLKGAIPSGSPEAREALRQGKLPTQAKIRVTRGELVYAFMFNADALSLSAVKIPAVVKDKDDGDEQFYERMHLVEDLEALFGALYADFVAIRLSAAWAATVLPAIRAWVQDEPTIDAHVYRKLRGKVAPLRRPPGAEKKAPAEAPRPAAPRGKKAGAPQETALVG